MKGSYKVRLLEQDSEQGKKGHHIPLVSTMCHTLPAVRPSGQCSNTLWTDVTNTLGGLFVTCLMAVTTLNKGNFRKGRFT